MKLILLFLVISCVSSATEIIVPKYFSSEQKSNSGIIAAGFYSDNDKIVWAVELPDLNIAKQKGDVIGINIDSDDNINTGRFPGTKGGGIDWMFGIDVKTKKSVFSWYFYNNNKKVNAGWYPDDYQIDEKKNVLYIAMKKSNFDRFPIKNKFNAVITLFYKDNKKNSTRIVIDSQSPTAKSFHDTMSFTRYGADISIRDKRISGKILLDTPEFIVWNSFSEAVMPLEKPYLLYPQGERQIQLKSAKGEAETFLLCLSSKKSGDETINIDCSNLCSKSAVIDKKYISISPVGYVKTERGDEFPDIILRSGNIFKIVPDRSNVFIFRVDTPRNIEFGNYSGVISFKFGNNIEHKLPIELHVFDFEIPQISNFKTAYSLKKGHMKSIFKGKNFENQYDYLLEICKNNRFGGRIIYPSPILKYKDKKLDIDWKEFDAGIDKAFREYNFNVFQPVEGQLGSHDDISRGNSPIKLDNPEFSNYWEQYVRQLSDHMKAKGLSEKMLFNIWDEPYTCWQKIIYAARIAKTIEPQLKICVIGNYAPEIADIVDIWVVAPMQINTIKKNHGTSKKIWLYNNNMSGGLRGPLVDIRMKYWFAFKYEIEGYLDSEINFWSLYESKNDPTRFNPLVSHIWIYPDIQGGRPYSSLRVEMIRDGLEDFEYLYLLKKLVHELSINEKAGLYTVELENAKALFNELDSVSPDLKNNGDIEYKIFLSSELEILREKIALEIEKLQNILYTLHRQASLNKK